MNNHPISKRPRHEPPQQPQQQQKQQHKHQQQRRQEQQQQELQQEQWMSESEGEDYSSDDSEGYLIDRAYLYPEAMSSQEINRLSIPLFIHITQHTLELPGQCGCKNL